jgi:hypothetical protein
MKRGDTPSGRGPLGSARRTGDSNGGRGDAVRLAQFMDLLRSLGADTGNGGTTDMTWQFSDGGGAGSSGSKTPPGFRGGPAGGVSEDGGGLGDFLHRQFVPEKTIQGRMLSEKIRNMPQGPARRHAISKVGAPSYTMPTMINQYLSQLNKKLLPPKRLTGRMSPNARRR